MSVMAEASFAFGVGVATFFSPCVYALLPGYVGYYVASVDGDTAPLSGALGRGVAASVGAVGTFVLLSIPAALASSLFESLLTYLEPLIGVALIALGTLVLWKGMLSFKVLLPERRASVFGFGIFGAVYALAATACVLPMFLSVVVLSVGFSTTGTVFVLGSYATGFAVLMLSATVAIAIGQQALLDTISPRSKTLTRIAGVVIILAGFVQLYIAFWVGPVTFS